MEYFAEGVQSYFNTGDLSIEANGPPGRENFTVFHFLNLKPSIIEKFAVLTEIRFEACY